MVPSPCISVCKMDEASGFCLGCKRTTWEITMWLYFTNAEKSQVLETLVERRIE